MALRLNHVNPAKAGLYVAKRRFAAVIAIALVLGSSTGLDAQTKGLLWKVQSGPRVMYLAGSVHALSADVYPLSPAFTQAYEASDTLLEEIDLETAGLLTLGPMLLSRAMYQDGRTFDKAVSKETLDLVTAHLKGMPMAAELIRPMKPWMVMLMLSAMPARYWRRRLPSRLISAPCSHGSRSERWPAYVPRSEPREPNPTTCSDCSTRS